MTGRAKRRKNQNLVSLRFTQPLEIVPDFHILHSAQDRFPLFQTNQKTNERSSRFALA